MTDFQKQASSLDNVKSYMDEYAELRRSKQRIEERMKELDPIIRPSLEGRGAIVYNGAQFECRVSEGRKTLDKKAVADAGIDLEPYMKQGAPLTTLTVKIVNEI